VNTRPEELPNLDFAGQSNAVLVIVDVQNDFCRGGALEVAGADEIVPLINRLSLQFKHVILTQDWHCPGHISFASAHPGKKAYDRIELSYGPQTLWPDHCVRGTAGADFHRALDAARCELVIRKGCDREIDSYSAFFENDRQTPTGLKGYLQERGFTDLFIVGLATDFCVAYSAIDARRLGFRVTVIEDACRAIDVEGSLDAAWAEMEAAGVRRA
jgi:eukaryotic-like serine/threonine-protein kinase